MLKARTTEAKATHLSDEPGFSGLLVTLGDGVLGCSLHADGTQDVLVDEDADEVAVSMRVSEETPPFVTTTRIVRVRRRRPGALPSRAKAPIVRLRFAARAPRRRHRRSGAVRAGCSPGRKQDDPEPPLGRHRRCEAAA